MFDKYEIKLTLIRDMLGTNPLDPNVMDTHILDRQRKLIAEKKNVTKEVNKYLDQLEISQEKGDTEISKILDKLESIIGTPFTPEERKLAITGELASLKETFKEFDIKGTAVFFYDKKTGRPCIGDHMIYGFLKASAEALGRTLAKKNATMLHSISYTQSIINQHVRCQEQFIVFDADIKKNDKGEPIYLQRSLRAMTAQGPRISLAKSEVVEAGASLQFTLKVLKDSPMTQKVLETLLGMGELTGLGQWRNSGHGMFSYELKQK